MDPLPTYHLIANATDVDNSQYNSAYDGARFLGTLVYDGKVYDHILFYNRGEVSTYVTGKNKWRFRFNRGHAFEVSDDYGNSYKTKKDALNLNACASPWVPVHRGMAGLDEVISHRLYELAGLYTPAIDWIQFRVIDAAEEAPAGNQYAGDLWGLYNVIEHPNGDFLRERDLPSGNVYKIEGPADKKHQGDTQPTDNSDWDSFYAASANLNTVTWWRKNLHLESYFGFRAINRLVGNVDVRAAHQHYFYHHPNDLWYVIPWDLDMVFVPETHWAGVIRQEACLQHNELALEFKNRARELHDLLCTDPGIYGGQAAQLVEEYSRFVQPTGRVLTATVLDRYLWNYHPRTATKHRGQFYVTPKTDGKRGGTWTRYLDTPDHFGSQKFIRDYVTDTDTDGWSIGDGDQYGYGYEYLALEAADPDIPDTPTIRYVGTGGFPVNNLLFETGEFSGRQAFAAMSWRVGEISNPATTHYTADSKWAYEITAKWESGVLTNYHRQVKVAAGELRVGSTYRARVRMKDATGRWSHWSAPLEFVAGPPNNTLALLNNLCISEVMYNPQGGGDYEFVELHNRSDTLTLDLQGVSFTRGIDYTFASNVTMPPGGYLAVVNADPTNDFAGSRDYYGLTGTVSLYGPYGGKLDNGGEELRLKTASGSDIVSSFTYADARGWPLAADGAGHSLVPLVFSNQADRVLDYGGNWRASTYLKGSPGREDPEPFKDIVINEFMAHTDTGLLPPFDSDDWIELYNTTLSDVGLNNWYLSDDASELTKWGISGTRSVAATQWITFTENLDFHMDRFSGFGLDKSGERIYLSYLAGSTNDRVADCVRFEGQANSETCGRYPDGVDGWHVLTPTTNAANARPGEHVVISEIMYHPAPTATHPENNTNDEYMELYNPLNVPVILSDAVGAWRLDGEVDFTFPAGTVLPAHGRLVVTGFDPEIEAAARDAFLASYGLTNGQVRLLGPFSGNLSNAGGRVALERPLAADPPATQMSWIIVDEVIYADVFPWPMNADGTGLSLERQATSVTGNDPATWRGSFQASPGTRPFPVGIATPLHGETVRLPTALRIAAGIDYTSVSGPVQRVEFFLDFTNSLCVDTTAPYECTLSPYLIRRPGSYTLTVTLTDSAGTHASPATPIHCVLAKRVSLTSPPDGAVFVPPYTVNLATTVSDEFILGTIAGVEFFLNETNSLRVDPTRPYTCSFDCPPIPGSYTLTAALEDGFGTTVSDPVHFDVYTNHPTISAPLLKNHTLSLLDAAVLPVGLNLNGLPPFVVSTEWIMRSGPGSVIFGNPFAPNTTAMFTEGGTYVLDLVTRYGGQQYSNTVTLTVLATNTYNTARYEETFEDYAHGVKMIGMQGWYGLDRSAAVVETNTYADTYTNGFFLPSAEHDLVLAIDGSLTNEFVGMEGHTNLWVDMVVETTRWFDSTKPEASDGAQFTAYINSNGLLAVWNCPDPAGAPGSNAWTVLPDTFTRLDGFARLTVHANYERDANGYFHFSLYLNGIPVTNPVASFACAVTNNAFLSRLKLRGEFRIDDLVVDGYSPFEMSLIKASAGPHGRILPAGHVYVQTGSNQVFHITADPYFHIAQVHVDGTVAGPFSTYTFNNVTSGHTIGATFAADLAAQATPHWWLAQMAPEFTNDFDTAALGDQDHDGLLTWEEYIAGTHATTPASVFEIMRLKNVAGDRTLLWLNAPGRLYSVYRDTSPFKLKATLMTNAMPADVSGTNIWIDRGAGATPGFYWLDVHKP